MAGASLWAVGDTDLIDANESVVTERVYLLEFRSYLREHTARPVLPKAPGVWKNATLQNLTLDEL